MTHDEHALAARIAAHFDEGFATLTRARDLLPAATARAAVLLADALRRGHRVLVCGNGGSAAEAQHFASELVNRFERDRPALAAIALGTDVASLTSIGNDMGYDAVYARQVEALGRPGDVLVALTTSGRSPNILRAVDAAHGAGLAVVALTGSDGGPLATRLGPTDIELRAPSNRTARSQEIHLILIHALCDLVDELLDTR